MKKDFINKIDCFSEEQWKFYVYIRTNKELDNHWEDFPFVLAPLYLYEEVENPFSLPLKYLQFNAGKFQSSVVTPVRDGDFNIYKQHYASFLSIPPYYFSSIDKNLAEYQKEVKQVCFILHNYDINKKIGHTKKVDAWATSLKRCKIFLDDREITNLVTSMKSVPLSNQMFLISLKTDPVFHRKLIDYRGCTFTFEFY